MIDADVRYVLKLTVADLQVWVSFLCFVKPFSLACFRGICTVCADRTGAEVIMSGVFRWLMQF